MVASNLLKFGLALSFIALSQTSQASGMLCFKAHTPHPSSFQKYGERGRVERRAVLAPEASEIKGASDEVMMAFPGGGLFLSEKPLSAKTQAGVMEFIRLWTYTPDRRFPAKTFLDKETFTLGLPLGNGYTVEFVYKSFSRNENLDSEGPQIEIKDRYLLSDIHARGPEGVFLKGSGHIREIDGSLTQRQVLDLTDLPGLSNFDFLAHVPNEVSGDVLLALERLAPLLSSNFTKQELADLARQDSYYKLRWMASTRNFTNILKNYHWRGIGKGWVKYITFPLVGVGLYLGAKSYFPEQVQNFTVTVQKAVALDHYSWIQVILNRMSTMPQTPIAIREQLNLLSADFKKSVNADSLLMPMTEKYPMSLDNRPRYQIGKEEYIWVQRSFDKAENKEITLIYAAKISPQTGMAYLAVTPVDPVKYKTLIQYLESQGAFTLPAPGTDSSEDSQ